MESEHCTPGLLAVTSVHETSAVEVYQSVQHAAPQRNTKFAAEPAAGATKDESGSCKEDATRILVDASETGVNLSHTFSHDTVILEVEDESAFPSTLLSKPEKPVSWRSLPRKNQLLILTLARLAEPFVLTSLQSYVYFMLKSFDPEASDSKISSHAGVLIASFTAAQCLTAVIWGRLADKEWMGRKKVLLAGLVGTLLSTIGFGFSRSFIAAVAFRSLGGALNGNIGIIRTMVSEIILEKKYQPKAFLLIPVTANCGILLGPILGGWLQDPARQYPDLFGPGSKFGGEWMLKYPYALPNLLISIFLFCSALLVLFGLEETHVDRRNKPDQFVQFGQWTFSLLLRPFRHQKPHSYSKVDAYDITDVELSPRPHESIDQHTPSLATRRPKLPYGRIFQPNVIYTFLSLGLLYIHLSSFGVMWFIFLSTPRFDPGQPITQLHTLQHLPFSFTGGLGLPPPDIGFAIGIVGAVGLVMQFGVYSRVTHKLGILGAFRRSLLIFPIVLMLVPYLAVIPTTSPPPHKADGALIWICIACLMFIQVCGRTFAIPISQILVNNCTPHPSALATVHGFGTTVSAGCRTLGPVIWSALYGWGLKKGVVGAAWWMLSVEAIVACGASLLLYEGSGHEIRLEGDPP